MLIHIVLESRRTELMNQHAVCSNHQRATESYGSLICELMLLWVNWQIKCPAMGEKKQNLPHGVHEAQLKLLDKEI